MDGATWTLRVTATGRDAARVSTRKHQFVVGRPLEFDADAPSVSALEYLLGALGGEIVGGLRVFARRRRISVDDVEAVVTATVEGSLAYLEVVGETGQPRIGHVAVKVFVASPQDAATVRGVFDAAIAALPLVGTLRVALPLDIVCVPTP